MKIRFLLYILFFALTLPRLSAQDISVYQQFNGRFDFTFLGNTLNPEENGNPFAPCIINTSSSASLNLDPENIVEKAFLYWAGSGEGDFNIKLNGIDITPERTFNVVQINPNANLIFFSAFKDITDIILETGNGEYTFSDMDLNAVIPSYCPNRTNFGGWAIVIIYKNDALPLNQLNLYDGLQFVSQFQQELNVSLPSLNVIDNEDAKIGFLAWEGDKLLDVDETLKINGNTLSNALNPPDNAFNGTNTFTGSDLLFNMDLDVYNIENNIAIGDTSASIQMTSGQDFVMINAIVTKLNSQLPDATIVIDNLVLACNSRVVTAQFTVSNVNSTNELQGGVPIAIYANGVYIASTQTAGPLAIGESITDQITFILPDGVPDVFELTFVVDDIGNGAGIVTELLETNNSFMTEVALVLPPQFNVVPDVLACNEGLGSGTFDFSDLGQQLATDPLHDVTFYENAEDAQNEVNPILNSSSYFTQSTPKLIYFRIESDDCYNVGSFGLTVENCPPIIYNYVSANDDGVNDIFFVKGLRDIFVNFQIEIYNRWGMLIWTGNNNTSDWNGIATKGWRVTGDEVPDGTYFYVLKLNDPDYISPFTGFIYLNR